MTDDARKRRAPPGGAHDPKPAPGPDPRSTGDAAAPAGSPLDALRVHASALEVRLEALRLRELRYRSLFESIDEGFVVVEMLFDGDAAVDAVVVEANRAQQRLTGLGHVVGRRASELVPGIERAWFERLGSIARGGAPQRFEERMATLGRWFDVYASRVAGDPRPLVAVVFSDATERKTAELALREREAHLAFLDDVAGATARARSDEEIIREVGAMIGAHLGVSGCVFSEVDDARGALVGNLGWQADGVPPAVGRAFGIDDHLTPTMCAAARAAETIVVRDARAQLPAADALGVGAFVAVPFHRRGRWKFLLSVFDARPRDWTDAEIHLLRELGHRLFPRLERARAEAELRASQAQQAFLLQLSDALRPLSDAVAIQHEAARRLGRHLGASRAFYCEVADDVVRIHRDYADGVPSIAGSRPFEAWGRPLLHAYTRGERLAIDDVARHPLFEGEDGRLYAAARIASAILVPLAKRGRSGAVLGVAATAPRAWTPDEIRLAEEVAERTWAAAERARAEAALRESEAKYRTLFDSIDEGFNVIEVIFEGARPVDYRLLEVNPAQERMTGLRHVVGKRVRELAPDIDDAWIRTFGQVALTGEPIRFENRADEVGRWFDVYVSRIGAEDSRRVALVFNDITDRKRREANLAFLADIRDVFTRQTSADDMMRAVGAKVGAFLDLPLAYYFDVEDEDGLNPLHPIWDPRGIDGLPQRVRIDEFVSDAFVRLARAGETIVGRDVQDDPRIDRRRAAALGVRAFVSVPYRRDGAWRFLLTVCDTRPRDWRQDEIELLRELAGLVFPRLERARAEQELREREERQSLLMTLADTLQALGEPDDIQREAARVLGEYLRADRTFYGDVDERGDALVVRADYFREGLSSLEGRYRLSDFVDPFVAFQGGQSLVLADIPATAMSQTAQDAYASLGVVAAVCVPLFRGRRLVWSLNVASTSVREWTLGEVTLAEEVARRTWDAIERARAEAALRASEARYRMIVDGARDYAIFTTDAQGIIDSWPPGAEAVFGWPASEAVGQPFAMTFVPEDRASGVPALECRVAASEGVAPDVRWHQRRDGARVFIEGMTRALRDSAGLLRGFLKVGQDVTQRRALDEALRANEARYRTLVQNVRDYAIFMIDAGGRITEWTEGAERVMGHSAAEAIGRNVSMLYPPEDAAEPAAEIEEAVRAGRVEREGWRVRKGGERFWANEISTAVRSPDGTLAGFAKISRDLTERRRAEDALQSADRRKDEFLATLAHELRNPLAPLRNGLHIARLTNRADPTLARTIEMMDRQLTHLVRLVDDLLDVGRISSGKLELRRRPILLAEALASSVESARVAIEARQHKLDVDVEPGGRPVLGDFDRLAQVFTNLLTNAAKYTEPGGHIRLRLAQAGEFEIVQVEDDGIGIPPDELPRVFDLFSQVRSHQGRTTGGLGIGLSIVRTLVELHGGTVEASSAGIGCGSTFSVRIPALAPDAPALRETPDDALPAAPTRARRVLIVDDNVDAAASLAQLLRLAGHDAVLARDGQEALDMGRADAPDLVLLDLGMPLMDGFETARRLRALPGGERLRIAALTGWGQDSDRARTHDAGFDWHLVKPVDIDALDALLAQLDGS